MSLMVIQNRAFIISFSVEKMVMYLRLIDQETPFYSQNTDLPYIDLIICPTVLLRAIIIPQEYLKWFCSRNSSQRCELANIFLPCISKQLK